MEDYSKYLIRDYNYWSVQVHSNQGYLGRCIIWCKRENALDLADARKGEQEELFMILEKLKRALKKSFQVDWFNYAFLGNETMHLHGHVVPRYASPREFAGINFNDDRYGHNYQTDKNFITPPELLEAVRIKIKENLE